MRSRSCQRRLQRPGSQASTSEATSGCHAAPPSAWDDAGREGQCDVATAAAAVEGSPLPRRLLWTASARGFAGGTATHGDGEPAALAPDTVLGRSSVVCCAMPMLSSATTTKIVSLMQSGAGRACAMGRPGDGRAQGGCRGDDRGRRRSTCNHNPFLFDAWVIKELSRSPAPGGQPCLPRPHRSALPTTRPHHLHALLLVESCQTTQTQPPSAADLQYGPPSMCSTAN